jgi:hypothetical protein
LNFQYSRAIDLPIKRFDSEFGPQVWSNRMCKIILPGSNSAGCAGGDQLEINRDRPVGQP